MADDSATEILPVADDHAALAPTPATELPTDFIGRTLGKFTIVELLGRGGSGEVFRAEQPQLGRSAVIKILRRDIDTGPVRIDRFLREAKLASRLDHPYAAHIYAFGAEPDGVLWIAMEYVRGATLDELVGRRGAIPPAVFGPLFVRLCEVVHTAHDLGIVHRDIKGSNVMVIERAGQLLPKLLDFGIAKGTDGGVPAGKARRPAPAPGPASDHLTMSGATLGSPHYMAPEQWRSAADVDARADIYALGVLAYRCVAGRLPFADVAREHLADAHTMQAPPPLPASVPLATADVILRALAKEPHRRWPTALAFGEGMRRAAGGATPEAVPMLEAGTRDTWFRGGPQPIADAIARLSRASTTVEADAALRELVAITCRWVAVLGLAQLGSEGSRAVGLEGERASGDERRRDDPRLVDVREAARAMVGSNDNHSAPWVRLARAALGAVEQPVPGLAAAILGSDLLEQLADRLDDRDRAPADELTAPGARSGSRAPGVTTGTGARKLSDEFSAANAQSGSYRPAGPVPDEFSAPSAQSGMYAPVTYRPAAGKPSSKPPADAADAFPPDSKPPEHDAFRPPDEGGRPRSKPEHDAFRPPDEGGRSRSKPEHDAFRPLDEGGRPRSKPEHDAFRPPDEGGRSRSRPPDDPDGPSVSGVRSAVRYARTAAGLAFDIGALADALAPLETMLAYQLVAGREQGAESWQGARRRDRERVVVWGEPLGDGEVALLDAAGRVVTKLSPLVQVVSPLPSAEPELFMLWRSGRGAARLVAAPWGFERDDEAAAAALAILTTQDDDTLAEAQADRSPYPGLAAYGVGDADHFVGREREIEALANRLVRAPLIAVLGPSGAGKSSFLHAGVLPRLAEHYEIITMRPGRHPLHALAAVPPIAAAIGALALPATPVARRAPTAPATTATMLAGSDDTSQGDITGHDNPSGDLVARAGAGDARDLARPGAGDARDLAARPAGDLAARPGAGDARDPAGGDLAARARRDAAMAADDAIAAQMAADDAAIVARLRQLGDRAPRGLVIVIDQLEELVTLCADPVERRRFAGVLAAAADGPTAPVRVAVTLRDDFAVVLESEEAFRGRFEVFVLAAPSPEALRRILVEPARRAQVAVDARVVDDIVTEVAGRPASLPLLSFTAARLWQDRDRAARRISHDAYLALGGVAGALSTYADQVYGSLARRDQEVVRDLFSRLVATDGTRIPSPRAELEQLLGGAKRRPPYDDPGVGRSDSTSSGSPTDPPGARGVLAHLIDARLLVVRDDGGELVDPPAAGARSRKRNATTEVVEIVHECLAERWPRLARWRSEDAADRALLGDVRAAARRWDDGDRRPDLLWHGEALAELRRLVQRSTAMTDVERAFAEAGDRAEKRKRLLRRALLVGAMVALAGIAVVMGYLSRAANLNRQEAEDSARSAEESARQARDAARLAEERLTASLIAQGRRELNDNRALAALAYFGEALRRGADSPALRQMISLAARGWPHEVAVRRGANMTHAESSPRGWAVSGDAAGRLYWWGPDGAALADQTTGVGFVSAMFRQRDDRLIVVGRKALAIIDPATRKITHTFAPKSEPLIAHLGPGAGEITTVEHDGIRVYDLAGAVRRQLALDARMPQGEPRFSPEGTHLLYGTMREVEVVDLRTMATRTVAKNNDGLIGGAADGSVTGYVDADGLAHLLAADGVELRTFRPANRPHSLVFSPTGDRIGALAENSILVHDASGKPLHSVPIKSSLVIIEIRGDDVWLGTTDGVVQRWRRGSLITSLPTQLGDLADFHVGDTLAMSIGMDGAFVAVRATAEQLRLQPRLCDEVDMQAEGIAAIYRCPDKNPSESKKVHVYSGATKLAVVPDDIGGVAYHAPSGTSVVATRAQLTVYRRGERIASSDHEREHYTNLAFEDADRVIVTRPEEDGHGVWRWTFAQDRWERIATIAKAGPVAFAAGGMYVGTSDHQVVRVHNGAEASRVDVGARPLTLAASRDGGWLVASLQNGVAAILEGATGTLVRQLEQTDSLGGTAAFDAAGDLLLRPGRGTMTIWDRNSGDSLVWNLDLLRNAASARFDDAGRLEVNTWEVGTLDIQRDRRPVAELLADIDCRVPLRVIDGRLGPAVPRCRP